MISDLTRKDSISDNLSRLSLQQIEQTLGHSSDTHSTTHVTTTASSITPKTHSRYSVQLQRGRLNITHSAPPGKQSDLQHTVNPYSHKRIRSTYKSACKGAFKSKSMRISKPRVPGHHRPRQFGTLKIETQFKRLQIINNGILAHWSGFEQAWADFPYAPRRSNGEIVRLRENSNAYLAALAELAAKTSGNMCHAIGLILETMKQVFPPPVDLTIEILHNVSDRIGSGIHDLVDDARLSSTRDQDRTKITLSLDDNLMQSSPNMEAYSNTLSGTEAEVHVQAASLHRRPEIVATNDSRRPQSSSPTVWPSEMPLAELDLDEVWWWNIPQRCSLVSSCSINWLQHPRSDCAF